jgi:hypothetical protein
MPETSVNAFKLFTDPDQFFAAQTKNPSLRGPMLVVVTAGLTSVLSIAVVLWRFMGVLSGIARDISEITYVVGMVTGFVGTFAMWVVFSAMMYLVAKRLGGKGSFRTLLQLTGWAFYPSVISGLVTSIVAYHVYTGAPLPNDPAQLQTFIAGLRDAPLFVVSRALSIVFALWQGFVFTFAVKCSMGLGYRNSAKAAVVPTVLWIIIQLVF